MPDYLHAEPRVPLIGVNSSRTRITDRILNSDPLGPAKDAGLLVGAMVAGTAAVGTFGAAQTLGWPAFLTAVAEDAGYVALALV